MVFESVVVFFATLVGFGLRVHPDPAVIWGVGVGLSVTLMLFPAFLGKPGTYVLGWVFQIIVVFLGIWVPLMFLLGAIFLGMWGWAMIAGATIDSARAAKARLDGQDLESEQ
jgi:sterol desaturase/sphingolipid hydroxylase (fatty acid hydroxylase superfamily)